MRVESSITAVSWIPSEAIRGMPQLPFGMHIAHYDEPPPDRLDDLAALRDADRFRFANHLTAWIDVSDGRITGHGQGGAGMIGATTMRVGGRAATFTAVALPDLTPEPEVGPTWVRFTQTAGGRTGVPAPRHVRRPPFVQVSAPLAWSTLELTLHADGRVERRLAGASPFPRHWVYDADGALVAKSGLIDFDTWYRSAFGRHSPWGDEDSPSLTTEVETALERELSVRVMRHGARPTIKRLRAGRTLTEQGAPGDCLYLLLDGVLRAEVDGNAVAELGPGALVGERALLEGGRRTATLVAVTRCTVACAAADAVDRQSLEELASGHHREDR